MKFITYRITGVLLYLLLPCLQSSVFAASTHEVPEIVTTVSPITNIVQNIGGKHIKVTGIVPDGTDSHTFEPIPSDIKILRAADMIIVNGLDLELPTLNLARKVKRPETSILQLGNLALNKADWQYDFSFPREHGHPNPHLWLNIELVMRYADIIKDNLIMLDPANKTSYQENTVTYLAKLKRLDQAIFNCIETIPANNRKLVTYHDSFAYFAPRYGMTVIAAIQPSDFSEPGPQEVISIIKQIRETGVPAIFGSEVFPSKVMKQIAREAKAKFIDQLSDDELPAPPNNSFIGMMADNMVIMTEALGGNSTCMADIDASNIAF
jgi:zinc/manganese transport system substrate-binding protein/manganese/iron transport system substrate-binding protein